MQLPKSLSSWSSKSVANGLASDSNPYPKHVSRPSGPLSRNPLNPHRIQLCPLCASFRYRGWGLYMRVWGAPSVGSRGQTVYEESALFGPKLMILLNFQPARPFSFQRGKPSRPGFRGHMDSKTDRYKDYDFFLLHNHLALWLGCCTNHLSNRPTVLPF